MKERPPPLSGEHRGVIARMVHNRVLPNIVMLVFLCGGLFMATRIKQEVFPEFDLDMVTVRVPYPGASPEEVERGILLAIEEAVQGIDGVEEVGAVADEGVGTVRVELEAGTDQQRVYQDIQQQVGRIRTFPVDAEDPVTSLVIRRREVLDLQIYGDVDEWVLRELAEQVRDRLLQSEGITQIDYDGVRAFEIHVQISKEQLRALGLTLSDVARRIRENAVEVPGGTVRTDGGDVLLRMRERRDWAEEFAEIPIVTSAEGAVRTLGEIAEVEDTFADVDVSATFNGKRSIGLEVYRVGEQTPIGVSDAVRSAMKDIEEDLPPGVAYAISWDMSNIYRQRLNLLLRNGLLGLSLVLVVLGLFLDFRLAFWVTLGIPTAFLGAFLFLPWLGVTINMISMFAFIVAIGIVVDDAIVAGENIYRYREEGAGFVEAAIKGARDVAMPIGFSIASNVVAFMPLLFVPGFMGKVWAVIPMVVLTVFLISWVEALIILPSHLAHGRQGYGNPIVAFLARGQQAFSRFFVRMVESVYRPFLGWSLRARYLTVAVMFSTLALVTGYAFSGRLGFILMPKAESDRAEVTARLPFGCPPADAENVRDQLVASAHRVWEENGGDELATGVFARINEHEVSGTVFLTAPEIRPISTTAFTDKWREATGPVLGVESLRFVSDSGGPGRGPSVTVELAHRDIDVLDRASEALAAELAEFAATKDVDDGYTPGKRQLDFAILPEGRSLGLTANMVARQVRDSFYGSEALRQQRGRNEVKVLVRLPDAQRVSEFDIEQLLIRTPAGTEVPLREIATVDAGRAYTTINRRNGRRTVTVTSNVAPISETNRVLEDLRTEVLPRLADEYPGLSFSFEGRQAEMRKALDSLKQGMLLAMIVIYVLLAIPFRSYVQPLIVMIAIPFGIVGAIFGHLWMGYSLSIISLMGVVALSGVVVNDSLLMVDLANRLRKQGMDAREAILTAGVRRFRPILLTTLTTFGGLAPMIFETSRQARFMIPMAVSLGYGIVFATGITLLLIPSLYVILDEVATLPRSLWERLTGGRRTDRSDASRANWN